MSSSWYLCVAEPKIGPVRFKEEVFQIARD